jgi:hypothetical protein
MALLNTLGLRPTVEVAKAIAASSGPDPKIAAQAALADFDKALKGAVAFAGQIKDKALQAQFVQALKGADATKRAAAKAAADEQRKAAEKALADLTAAKEAADQAIAGTYKAEAKKLQGQLQGTHERAYAAWTQAQARQKALAEKLKALDKKDPSRAKLEAAKSALDKKVEQAHDAVTQAQKDLKTIGDFESKPVDLAAILVSQKSNADLVTHVEVDLHEQESKFPGEKWVTTTTTTFKDGKATVETSDSKRTIGLDGVTTTESSQTETIGKKGSEKTSSEQTTNVSLDGVTSTRTTKEEKTDKKGRTSSTESSNTLQVGKGGVTASSTDTVTDKDGSSVSTSGSVGAIRGDGKAGAAASVSGTVTDKDGTATGGSLASKTGMKAGKDGYGAFSETAAGLSDTKESGRYSKGTLSFGGNVSCNIGDPEGEPPVYPLTLKVEFAATLGAGVGHDKKAAPGKPKAAAKGSVDVKASAAATMVIERRLTAKELPGYVAALEGAAEGGKAAATWQELTIIAAGISKSWEVAKQMYLGGAGLAASVGKAEGDKTTLGSDTTAGVSGKLNVKAISVEAGYSEGSSQSTTATRNKEGGLDVETNLEESEAGSAGGGFDAGAAGMAKKGQYTLKTSIGYLVTIAAADDPDGKLLAAFHACKTPAAQKQFIEQNAKRIKLTGMKTGKAETESTELDLTVLGANLNLGWQQGTEEKRTTDAQGNMTESEVSGTQGMGGSFGVGDARIGDSSTSTATSKRDGQGNVKLDLKKEKTSTSLKKLAKKLPFMGDEPEGDDKKTTGLLSDVAGGGPADDGIDDKDLALLQVSKADLVKIAAIAKGDVNRWTAAAATSIKSYDAWRELGRKIAGGASQPGVVADELARFVGGDKSDRMKILDRLLRPSGDTSMGARIAFPDAAKKLQKPYTELVTTPCEARIEAKAKSDGPAEADKEAQKLLEQIDKLYAELSGSNAYEHQRSVQAEMLSAVNERKTALLAMRRKVAGKQSEADELEALKSEYGRLRKDCVQYAVMEEAPLKKVVKLIDGRKEIRALQFPDAVAPIRQLSDLYAIWKRDIEKASALAKTIGRPESDLDRYRPDLARFAKLKKACLH